MFQKLKNKGGQYNHKWKGGKPKCLDCGKITTQYSTKRCLICYRKTMKGETSPRYKKAMNIINCLQCNKDFLSYKTKYCSMKCYGESKIGENSGENHYLWISDRTLLKDDHRDRGGQLHRDWSKNVKNRDGWKCKISNDSCSGRLEAHHILSWNDHPKLRYELNNGITLCHVHHPRKRIDETKLSPYFQSLVAEMK